MEYEKGTQEQLDAAKEDARLLPYNTVFLSKKGLRSSYSLPDGEEMVRGIIGGRDIVDDDECVAFKLLDDSDFWYVDAADLEPIND